MTLDGRLRNQETQRTPTLLTYAGDPNGLLAAAEGTFCWDTVGKVLYVNTDGVTTWTATGGNTGCCLRFTVQTTDGNWTDMTPVGTAVASMTLAQDTAVTFSWQVIGFHPGSDNDHHTVIGRSSAYWIPPAAAFVETVLVDGIGSSMPAIYNMRLAVDGSGNMTFQVKGNTSVTVNWSLVATVCVAIAP